MLRLKDPFTQIVNNYGDTFVPTCTAVGKLAKSLKPKVEEVVERKQKPKALKTSEHKLLPAWYGLLVFKFVLGSERQTYCNRFFFSGSASVCYFLQLRPSDIV